MIWLTKLLTFLRKPKTICNRHYWGGGAGEGQCPVCGVEVVFRPASHRDS